MTTNDYTQGEAAKLYIGDLEFDAIRIVETGEYRMSQRQIVDAINVDKSWFNRLCKKGGVSLEVLQDMDLDWLCSSEVMPVTYKKNGKSVRAASRALKDADGCWEYHSLNGNKLARNICRALRQDSLCDRFDQVYGVRQTVEQRRESDNRIMQKPRKAHPLFGDDNMNKIAGLLKVSRNSVKLANFMWKFIYHTLNTQEIADLNTRNPIQSNGHRRYTIHQWLKENAADAHKQHFDKILMIVNSAPSEQEFYDLHYRLVGKQFQQKLFDF